MLLKTVVFISALLFFGCASVKKTPSNPIVVKDLAPIPIPTEKSINNSEKYWTACDRDCGHIEAGCSNYLIRTYDNVTYESMRCVKDNEIFIIYKKW